MTIDVSCASTIRLVDRWIDDGRVMGVQVYAARSGVPVLERAWGMAHPGVPMTIDTKVYWASAIKALVATATHEALAVLGLSVDDPVARALPEFSAAGKHEISYRHILTHTSCLPPNFPRGAVTVGDVVAMGSSSALMQDCRPGARARYHPWAYFILAAVLEIAYERPWATVIEDLFTRLHMTSSLFPDGSKPGECDQADFSVPYYRNADGDPDFRPAAHPHDWSLLRFGHPSAGGFGPMRDYACFLEHAARIHTGVLPRRICDMLTTPARSGIVDEQFGVVLDMGLGTQIDMREYIPNPLASPTSFGHMGDVLGERNVTCFFEPTLSLAAAVYINGNSLPAWQRHSEIAMALYKDLRALGQDSDMAPEPPSSKPIVQNR